MRGACCTEIQWWVVNSSIDHELLNLLMGQAATAIAGARLYAVRAAARPM